MQADEQARGHAAAHVRRRRWRVWVAALCCVVACGTAYALTRPAITMTQQTFCGMEAHTHEAFCYETVLICGFDEQLPSERPQPHIHTAGCYTPHEALVCGLDEDETHTHEAACYETEYELTCPLEEGDAAGEPEAPAHSHTDACYETRLICTMQEHQHSLSCYADPQADLEDASVWERTLPAELRGDRRADVVAVAESQLGYAASTRNYIVDENGAMHGYTRYGAWYGDPYGAWCAMFASFCLHYAGVPQTDFPAAAGCIYWTDQLTQAGLCAGADSYTPQPGDLAFFDTNGDGAADHVGIVAELSEDGAAITTIEGNVGGCVVRRQHASDAGAVLCYGILPVQTENSGETPDEPQPDPRTPLCGKEAHEHTENCYDESGELICTIPAHTHAEDCYLPQARSAQTFHYEDAQLRLTLTVESAQPLPDGTEADVQPMDAEGFAALSDGETDDGSAQRWLVRQIALVQDGEILDTSECSMTAELSVTDSFLQPLLDSGTADAAAQTDPGVTVRVMQIGEDDDLQELDSATIGAADAPPVFTVSIQSGALALLASTANPQFTVQYYAQIPRFDETGTYSLTVFDTTNGVLPTNSGSNPEKRIYLTKTDDRTQNVNAGDQSYYYTVAATDTLTQVYSDNTFSYVSSPGLQYIDKLADNEHYTRLALWVLNDGGEADSIDPADWTVYEDLDRVQFTNRRELAEAEPETYVYIRPGGQTTLRLVYAAVRESFTSSAVFYDYDISSGQNSDGRWRTGVTGINEAGNYGSSRNGQRTWTSYRDVLAFGNANTGTGMANYQFDGVYLNKYSGRNYGCTFGLADSLDENGHIVYNPWLVAPKLFNDGNANGKKTYSGSSLTFDRVGDTYTLTSANAAGAGSVGNLEKFFNPSPKAGTIYDGENNADKKIIFTNDFWPLDGVQKAAGEPDPRFGSYSADKRVYYQGFQSADGINGNWSAEATTFPFSDDGNNHNSYFGMQYAVEFTLTPDYVGPLEYTFFGDDDMWVFLDRKLVCDIGGVHSSVGEYVDLWDYLKKENRTETETHTLTIFYTERGASGSTCYMNFTLPSVSGVTLRQATGNLSVYKEVAGESDPTRDFTFTATFGNSDRAFEYYRFNADGVRVDTERELTLYSGQSFMLKAGEHIEFQDLPIGMQYTIEESGHSGYSVANSVNGVVSAGASAAGVLITDARNEVVFTNTRGTVPLTLQKLDQDGKPLTGAVFGLQNEAGGVIYAVENTDDVGRVSYTVPSSGTTQIVSRELYYIALKSDASHVIGLDTAAANHDVTLQANTGAPAQQFRVYRQTDGSYSFQCQSDYYGGLEWLDLDSGNLENRTLVHCWSNPDTPTTHDNQKWYLLANGDGSFTIKPRVAVQSKSSAVLDLDTGTVSEGQRIQIYEANGSSAQKWLLVPVRTETAPDTTDRLTAGTDGVLRLYGLLPGTYTLTETAAPAGYQPLTQPIRFHVDADGAVRLAEDTTTDAIVRGDGANAVLQVTNRREDLTLTLRKRLLHSTSTQKFTFTISYPDLVDPDGAPVTQTLELASGESGTVTIPYGVTVTIAESNHAGFAVSYQDGQTTLDAQDGTCSFEMRSDVEIVAVNAAGYELPSTGGGAVWYQLAGAMLLAMPAAYPAYSRIKSKKQKEKGTTRQ